MDSIIKIQDINIVRGYETEINVMFTDENGAKLNGKAAIKVNNKTIVDTAVVDGFISHAYDFSHLSNENYVIEVVYSGDETHNSAREQKELVLENPDPEDSYSLNDLQLVGYSLAKWIEYNGKLPRSVSMKNKKIHVENVLYMFVKNVGLLDNNNSRWIVLNEFQPPKKSLESIKETITLSKDDYVNVAGIVEKSMDETGVAPQYVTLPNSLKLGFMNMIYVYAQILANSSSEGLVSKIIIRPWTYVTNKD